MEKCLYSRRVNKIKFREFKKYQMKCLNCSKPVEKHTRPNQDRVVICTHCGELMQMNADLTLRKADAGTIQEMMKDEQLWKAVTDIKNNYCK